MSFSRTAEVPPLQHVYNTSVVAVDDGYARIKVCGVPPDNAILSQPPRNYLTKSSARAGRGVVSLNSRHGASWSADGEEFTVAENIDSEDTRFETFHWSPMNRVLVAHALAAHGWSGQKIKQLFLGMPLRSYYNDKGKASDFVAKKIANLMKPVIATSGALVAPSYEQVIVRPQAIAGFIDHYTTLDGTRRNGKPPAIAAVIDVGGRTTDIAFVRGGSDIDMRFSGTENIGVLDAHEALGIKIQERFSLSRKIEHSLLEDALRTKTFTIRGNQQDISDLVAEAVHDIETQLHRAVLRILGETDAINTVLLMGGGAEVFTGLQKLIQHATIVETPSYANARGLWKFGAYIYREDA